MYLEALEDAFVRPRGIVLASTAIADYVAFCPAASARPRSALMIGADGAASSWRCSPNGRLVASQLRARGADAPSPAELSRSLARQMPTARSSPRTVQLYRWQLANGSGPALPDDRRRRSARGSRAGASRRPTEFFEGARARAAAGASGRRSTPCARARVPVNLLPAEGRLPSDEGISLTTIVLVALAGVLLLVWGGSALVKDELLRRQLRDELAAVARRRSRRRRALQDEIADCRSSSTSSPPAAGAPRDGRS